MCVCVYTHTCVQVCHNVHLEARRQLLEVHSFLPIVWIPASNSDWPRLGGRCLHPWSHFNGWIFFFLICACVYVYSFKIFHFMHWLKMKDSLEESKLREVVQLESFSTEPPILFKLWIKVIYCVHVCGGQEANIHNRVISPLPLPCRFWGFISGCLATEASDLCLLSHLWGLSILRPIWICRKLEGQKHREMTETFLFHLKLLGYLVNSYFVLVYSVMWVHSSFLPSLLAFLFPLTGLGKEPVDL